MAYIAFASAKGSPGVTTTVAALAATWPVDRSLLVAEVDPAGGDLVVRFDLAPEPGLVSLAAAGRRELGADRLVEHTQQLPALDGQADAARRVLIAPVSAEQATASLSALRGGLTHVLDEVGFDVLVDCGRLDPSSPAFDLATNASVLVMVARPVVAEVHHLSARLGSAKPRAVSLLMVGDRPYSVSEVGELVGASPLGTLPVDARAAAVLAEGHPNAARLLRRSQLLRDARALAEGLCDWLGPQAAAQPAPSPQPVTGAPPAASPATAPRAAPPAPPPAGPVAPAAGPLPADLPPPSSPPVPLPPPPSHRDPASPAGAPPPGAPPGRRTTPQPTPARFTPTLPADDAAQPAPSPPHAAPPPAASPPVTWPSDGWPTAVAAPTGGGPDQPTSGDAWLAAAADGAPSARGNGRRRLGTAPKHFRRDPDEPGR